MINFIIAVCYNLKTCKRCIFQIFSYFFQFFMENTKLIDEEDWFPTTPDMDLEEVRWLRICFTPSPFEFHDYISFPDFDIQHLSKLRKLEVVKDFLSHFGEILALKIF